MSECLTVYPIVIYVSTTLKGVRSFEIILENKSAEVHHKFFIKKEYKKINKRKMAGVGFEPMINR